jgi:hypothetical protein
MMFEADKQPASSLLLGLLMTLKLEYIPPKRRHRWEDNIKMDVRGVEWDGMD